MENVSGQLEEVYSPVIDEVEFGSGLSIPPEAYGPNREQHEAGIVLQYISSEASVMKNGRVLGVTEEDLYSQGLNFVFGQAQKGGRAALMSLHRLRPEFWGQKKDRNLFLARAAKEAVHELGHTFGLSHCDKKSCVMTFSNRIADTDRKEPGFCESCWNKIEAAWR
ncbi:hypothetical protein AKJ65_06885 [candidate division MSBL1 archaeon SCGC-AAA259E19]|uniref:Archaemetzincin n=1 Tax=candidate division MSBL1 archaeon SCGC-AAA259E19 TaxID=1698264 RepID=A0A133UFC3_9EURY|nr:hypothetical protein AKJ65_06885 [candidate division MSBL1 archaeon SCGC-AAA259E19]